MKKAFNRPKVEGFCSKLALLANVACFPEFIYHKEFWKKFDLNKIENIGIVFLYTDNKKDLFKLFFPSRNEELTNNGHFEITQFYYSKEDSKIHAIIKQNNESRHFKLKTDNYLDRENMPQILKQVKLKLKKELDSFYGYWKVENPYFNNYITDGNLHNGLYKKVDNCDNYICL